MNLHRLELTVVLLDYEITDPGLKKLIDSVLSRIPDEYQDDFPSFSIYEGPAKEGAQVTEDFVMFDPGQLDKLSDNDDDVKTGIIAHELAHVFLKHATAPDVETQGLAYENEADKLAVEWGFAREVQAFRRKLGPATMDFASVKEWPP